mmetsp:Transcript_123503/g.283158  ORF Transcript_123503/g.283158 Transcript_123503/m.283158 type:complete len:215 (-) Transcript_123503:1680-2324(-)
MVRPSLTTTSLVPGGGCTIQILESKVAGVCFHQYGLLPLAVSGCLFGLAPCIKSFIPPRRFNSCSTPSPNCAIATDTSSESYPAGDHPPRGENASIEREFVGARASGCILPGGTTVTASRPANVPPVAILMGMSLRDLCNPRSRAATLALMSSTIKSRVRSCSSNGTGSSMVKARRLQEAQSREVEGDTGCPSTAFTLKIGDHGLALGWLRNSF